MGRVLALLLLLCSTACEKGRPSPYWGYAVEGIPNPESIEALKKETPFFPDFIAFYVQWPSEAPLQSFEAIWRGGSVPILTWEPKNIELEEVLSGKWDSYIHQVAMAIKAFGKPFLLRFAHEMNLEEYHWGTKGDYNAEAPTRYQKLYRYVVDRFRKDQVANVLWVFCPNADSVPQAPWNVAAAYYPGDAYVDFLGMDGYNWNGQTSFEAVFTSLYHQLKKINAEKPILVFETATDGTAQQKEAWIKGAQHTAQAWGLSGIIWFQVNKEKNWKMPHPAASLISRPPTQSAQDWAKHLKSF